MADRLKYVGNKILVSEKGVSYGGSVDKYNYLKEVVLILECARDLSTDTSVLSVSKVLGMSDTDILTTIIKTEKQITLLNQRMEYYQKKLENEEDGVDRLVMSEADKYAFKENLRITREDRKQRAFNKIVYHIAIEGIVNIIFKKQAKTLELPYSNNFNHISYSIVNKVQAIQPMLKVVRELVVNNGKPYIRLHNNF